MNLFFSNHCEITQPTPWNKKQNMNKTKVSQKEYSTVPVSSMVKKQQCVTTVRNGIHNHSHNLFLRKCLLRRRVNNADIRVDFYKILAGLAILILCLSCTKIPPHTGKSRDVVVISTEIDTNLIIDNLQTYNYIPQKEELFTFLFASDTAIKNYNRFHTIFLYGSLQDEFINTLLDTEARGVTKNDTFTLFKLDDLWAKGQLTIILATSDPQYIEPALSKYKGLISKILEDNYYKRIKENYYNKAFDKKTKDILKKFGVTFKIGKGWLIDSTYKDGNFIFAHTHFPDRSIFFYKEKKQEELNSSFAINKRNSLTEKYYSGDYILKELTYTENIEFKDMKGIRLKGVWQNDSLVAGGPFISYFLSKKDTIYIVDGMLFNPGERKSDYFTTLEVIINSFEIVEPND